MRTTVTLKPDVAAAVASLRRELSIGVSEAVNELIRTGLRPAQPRKAYRPRSCSLGLRLDVANVAEALEMLELPERR